MNNTNHKSYEMALQDSLRKITSNNGKLMVVRNINDMSITLHYSWADTHGTPLSAVQRESDAVESYQFKIYSDVLERAGRALYATVLAAVSTPASKEPS